MTTPEVEEAMNDFTTRQLNDTRYATKVAADYLALLYGGCVDAGRRRRIRATAGQVKAFLRNEWKLNTILQDGPSSNGGAAPKSRDDHRHHAMDAVVTALTDNGTIQALSRAAERARARTPQTLRCTWKALAEFCRHSPEPDRIHRGLAPPAEESQRRAARGNVLQRSERK